jgi:hypothetical protein
MLEAATGAWMGVAANAPAADAPTATLEAATGAWTGAAADAPAANAPVAMSEAVKGAWTGAAADAPMADAPAATLEAPTMGISFFSITGSFLQVFFFGCGENDGTGEAVAVRTREWVSIEGEKEGLYKDEGGMYRNMRLLCMAAACTET